ncbi:MAG TPA: acetolactate decarboxylase [Burkholderiaceae bacterium]|nr:acetolactate decarboxylase [Burkholderiaceae bacterium]
MIPATWFAPLLPFAMLAALAACHGSQASSAVPPQPASPPPSPAVSPPVFEQFGTMREVMHDGSTGGRVALAHVHERGCYAVGALAGLAGEVTVDDGVVYVERCPGSTPGLGTFPPESPLPQDQQATLLSVARVAAWRDVPLADAVDDAALTTAVRNAIGAPQQVGEPQPPVPFRVEGTVAEVTVHCVRGQSPTDPADRSKLPWTRTTGQPVPVTLIGFYAPGREGELTHHGTALHVHAVLLIEGRRTAAHADKFRLQPGARLQLPAAR